MSIVQSLLPWFLSGLVLGAGYLFLLHLSVRAIMGKSGTLAALGPLALRIGAAATAFYFAAQSGAMPVIAMLIGFVLVRSSALRWMKEG